MSNFITVREAFETGQCVTGITVDFDGSCPRSAGIPKQATGVNCEQKIQNNYSKWILCKAGTQMILLPQISIVLSEFMTRHEVSAANLTLQGYVGGYKGKGTLNSICQLSYTSSVLGLQAHNLTKEEFEEIRKDPRNRHFSLEKSEQEVWWTSTIYEDGNERGMYVITCDEDVIKMPLYNAQEKRAYRHTCAILPAICIPDNMVIDIAFNALLKGEYNPRKRIEELIKAAENEFINAQQKIDDGMLNIDKAMQILKHM